MSVGLALLGGAVAGSAAGTAAIRWPERGIDEPRRSTCSSCGHRIRARDLLPVIAWLRLRGRCRDCGARIDPRLLGIEMASIALAAAVVAVHDGARGVALTGGAIALLVATVVDVRHRIVPDRLTLPLAGVALAGIPMMVDRGSRGETIAWALGVPLALHALDRIVRSVTREPAIGGGDIKLLVGVLALAGTVPGGPPAVLVGAALLGGAVAAAGLATGRLERRSRLPFAPAIATAYVLVVLLPGAVPVFLAPFGGAR